MHRAVIPFAALVICGCTPLARAGQRGGTASLVSPLAVRDTAGVRAAALDYLDGFYDGDTSKFVRSVSPEVSKLGYWPSPDSSGRYASGRMRFADFVDYARRVRSGSVRTPAKVIKEITILDLLDQTAGVKVRASWGVDYLLLARHEDRWIITHVLWQTEPRPPRAPASRP